jgi:Tol biopolymer transport system component
VALSPGTRLGAYEILTLIGSGGMGEVYKARDSRLDRIVAIKVLPDALAADAAFRERFDREARAISQLTHPNICTLHDVGEQDGTAFLVMEFLDGETLFDRLQKGALAIEQALPFAIQIADALAAAHRAGIVHRDLKPGNVMLTRTGAKLLDFGLAKAGTVTSTAPGAMTAMPTTPAAMTAQGAIVGTFQYMAPEQIEGHEADARTDIFAFGCVVYEMLTGAKAFSAKTHASLIGAIMHAEPAPLASRTPLTSPALDRTVRKCLAKEPDRRWQSATDVADELRWIAEGRAGSDAPTAGLPRRALLLAWIVAAAATITALAVAGWAVRKTPADHAAGSVRFTIAMPDGWALGTSPGPLAVSPDGSRVAFEAVRTIGPSQIWVRALDGLDTRPVPGSDGGILPFWSPDGQDVGYYVAAELRRTSLATGESQVICATTSMPMGVAWGSNRTIVYGSVSGLWKVSADGGVPALLTTAKTDEGAHSRPWFLSDGRHLVFNAFARGLMVGSVDGPEHREIVSGGHGVFSLIGDELLFVRGQALMRQPLKPDTSAAVGDATIVLARVDKFFATTFVLAYAPVRQGGTDEMRWFDRAGRPLGVLGQRGDFSNVELSPDGSHVSVAALDPTAGVRTIWVHDSARGVPQRLTFGRGESRTAIWSPDGKTILFNRRLPRTGAASNIAIDFFVKAADGSGRETPVLVDGISKDPLAWSADGRYVLYRASGQRTGNDLYALPMDGNAKPQPVTTTQYDEQDGRIAPDSQWVAFSSDESGQMEVYVAQFPSGAGKLRISASGGTHPRWRRDGRELFFLSTDGQLMAVDVSATGTAMRLGETRTLFAVHPPTQAGFLYDVTPDGQRFLVITDVAPQPPLTVIANWRSTTKP